MRKNAPPDLPARSISWKWAALALLIFSPGAYAYLDPSTGSMVISAIVGIFASLALAVKTYWYKLKRFFRREGKAHKDSDLKS